MTSDLYQPHDRLFRKVFSEPAEAAGLLRAHVPQWLADTLDWSSLTLMPDSYVDDDLQASESDLLYAVEQRPGAAEPGDARRSLRLYGRRWRRRCSSWESWTGQDRANGSRWWCCTCSARRIMRRCGSSARRCGGKYGDQEEI